VELLEAVPLSVALEIESGTTTSGITTASSIHANLRSTVQTFRNSGYPDYPLVEVEAR